MRFLFTLMLSVVSLASFAYDCVVDGIYYSFRTGSYESNGMWVNGNFAYVTHDNNYVDIDPDPTNTNMQLQGGHYSGNIVIPSSIVYNEITYQVVGVDYNAFYKCTELASVVLPNSVKSIGSYAFQYCSSLTSITLPESVMSIESYAFAYCSSLTSITLPESLTSIGNRAFWYCSSLTNITLPESLTSIGYYAFAYCSSLTNITLPESLTSIGLGAFLYCSSLTSITLPESLTSIESFAFKCCSSLTNITLPESLTSIESSAFFGCSSLEEIELPEGLQYIAENLFDNCSSLKKVNIPSSIISFRSYAFYGCNSLNSITIPENSSISFENNAFSGYNGLVYNLSDMEIDSYSHVFTDKAEMDEYVFGKNDNQWYFTEYIGESTDLVLPDNINGEAYELYPNNKLSKDLTSIHLGSCIKSIPESYFKDFKNISEINLENVEAIGSSAFNGCTGLTELTLGKNLTSIGVGAFAGCYKLQTLNYNVVYFENQGGGNSVGYHDENGIYKATYYPLEFKSISTMNIGDEVEYIPNYAFWDNNNLTTVEFPNSVKTIGNYAFYQCLNLSSLTLGNSISNIGSNNFNFNAPLENLTVGNDYGLSYMLAKEYYDNTDYRYKRVIKKLVIAEDFADEQITGNFTNQNNLETIESNTVEPLAFALANPFTESQYSSIAVKVPEESAEKYKAAPVWKLFYVTSADCLLKLYNGNSEMQLIPQDGTERPEEATAVNAVMLIDEQLETGNGLLAMGNVVYRNERNNWVAGEINLSDAQPFYCPTDVYCDEISYTRNYDNTKWQALYLPFSLSYDEWKDKMEIAYFNNIHQYDTDGDGEIDRTTLEFFTQYGGELKPNTPYLARALNAGDVTLTGYGKTLAATPKEEGFVDCMSTKYYYKVAGIYQTKYDLYQNNQYAISISKGTFVRPTSSSTTVPPFRIYLDVQDRSGSGAMAKQHRIDIAIDGEVTGIEDVMIDGMDDGNYYDLQGRRVLNPSSGIYIQNGKKVIIK